MSKINLYFFGEEKVCLEDTLYFYGIQIAILSIVVFLKLITLVN